MAVYWDVAPCITLHANVVKKRKSLRETLNNNCVGRDIGKMAENNKEIKKTVNKNQKKRNK